MDYQLFADGSQLHRSCQPTDVVHTIFTVQDRILHIKDWVTENKLQLNEDKTETLLFNSSKLQDPPTSLSICQTTVTFSDSVRNLGFYLDKKYIHVRAYINFICETAFFELRHIRTIRHYLSVDATKTLVVSLALSRIDYSSSLLAGLPLSLISKLQKIKKTVQPVL